MPPTLHINLLGDFSIAYGDVPVTSVNTARLQSLLAYLVVHHNAAHLRQHLAFLLWPDSTEPQARTNLRREFHHLRHSIPDADRFLCADARMLQWCPDAAFTLDVRAFQDALAAADRAEAAGDSRAVREHLEAAATLYQGDLLPGCYDEWLLPERDRLRQHYAGVLERLVASLEDQRQWATAIRYAQRLLRHDPLHEATYRSLMRLHALHNDRAGALRVYHTCVTTLQRELGVEPSAATRAVYERVLSTDTASLPHTASRLPLTARFSLIGRQREWATLQAAWRTAMGGQAHVVCVAGEAGIGKTRLAEEVLHWATQQGIATAKTRCYAAEGRLAYAPVTEWLRSDKVREAHARLPPIWLTEIARLLPELLVERPDLSPPEPLFESWQRLRLFEALTRAVLAVREPLLLLIDDLQWCDQETLEWLHHLLRFDPAARLLIIGTVRVEGVGAEQPLQALLNDLRRADQLTELGLEPLAVGQTAALAAQVAGRELDVALAAQVYRETEGNPLFVVETLRATIGNAALNVQSGAWRNQGSVQLPPRVQAVITARLTQLSVPTQELASLAATIGRAFTFDVLAQASDGDDNAVVRGLDELWRRQIVREQGADGYDFSHDKLREVAYGAVSAAHRRLLHRRVAQALERVHAADLDGVSGQVAAHYERAGLPAQAIPYYQRAAAVAQRIYANAEAINLLEGGLALLEQLPPSAQRDTQELNLQLALVPLYRMLNGWTSLETERVLERAVKLCDNVGDDEQRVKVFYGLEALYVVQGRLEKVQQVGDDLHRLYQLTHGTAPPPVTNLMLIGARLHLGQITDAHAAFERMLATNDLAQFQQVVEEQGWNYAVHGRAWHAHALWLLGYPQMALHHGHAAVQLAHDQARPFDQVLALTYLAMLQQLCADEAMASAHAMEALALTNEHRSPYYRVWSAILASYALACEQPGTPTIEHLRERIVEFKATGARLRLPYYWGLLAQVCGRIGRTEEGLAAVDEGMAAAHAHNEHWWDAELHRLRGELLRASDAHAAEATLLRSIEIARQQQAKGLELRAAISLSRLWQAQGKASQAYDLLAGVYGWFTEGFATPDLQAAQALLDTLATA